MRHHRPVRIVSSGSYLPRKVSSQELESRYESVPEGFSEARSGVKSRHHVSHESNGFMGARAIEEALKFAEIDLSEIDLLISACATFDYPLPSQSSIIKAELKGGKEVHFPAFDVNSTCLSFISAFEIAAKLLDGEQYRRIVIVSSEIATKGLSTQRPETLTLFGDGAAAFVLEYNEEGESLFESALLQTYSEGVEHTIIKGGGNEYHFRDHPYDENLHSFSMDGKKLIKLAKATVPGFLDAFLKQSGKKISDFDHVIPHQASKVGIYIFKEMFDFTEGQLKENIESHGNCIAASIPILLHDCISNGEIKRGDQCMLIGTSAGFSIGALSFVY